MYEEFKEIIDCDKNYDQLVGVNETILSQLDAHARAINSFHEGGAYGNARTMAHNYVLLVGLIGTTNFRKAAFLVKNFNYRFKPGVVIEEHKYVEYRKIAGQHRATVWKVDIHGMTSIIDVYEIESEVTTRDHVANLHPGIMEKTDED